MYSRATTGLLSRSMMLHFAYADFEEQLNKNEKVHEIYKQYLAIEGIDPTLVIPYKIQNNECSSRCSAIYI